MNYARYLNSVGSRRKPSLIRELTKKLATAEPGTIFMGGGFPNPDLFPFQSVTVELKDNTQLKVEGNELRAALQYQPTMGYPPLHAELKNLVEKTFKPPRWMDSDLCITVGSQHALCAVLEMTITPGDTVVVPAPVYSSALSVMDPLCPVYLEVAEDAFGMQPSVLKASLVKWASTNGPDKMPKMLYLNPTGANPSGVVIPTERKKEIYKIAQEYDLLILEDDPYYFLHFEEEDPTSFLSLDVDGRVIRFDSFSKVLSSGLRVGFATGPKELIRVLELSCQHSVLHCSSMSQVLVNGVLKQWGIEGLQQHTDKVKAFYRRRRDIMVAAAEKHLQGLAEWHVPRAGMFLWMKVLGIQDTFDMIMNEGLNQKIMLLPGREFMTDRSKPCPYLRAAYSVVPEQDIPKGMERLANLIRAEQKRQAKSA